VCTRNTEHRTRAALHSCPELPTTESHDIQTKWAIYERRAKAKRRYGQSAWVARPKRNGAVEQEIESEEKGGVIWPQRATATLIRRNRCASRDNIPVTCHILAKGQNDGRSPTKYWLYNPEKSPKTK
jgi:hypothetical protein